MLFDMDSIETRYWIFILENILFLNYKVNH